MVVIFALSGQHFTAQSQHTSLRGNVAGRKGSTMVMVEGQLGKHVRKMEIFLMKVPRPFVVPLGVTEVAPEDSMHHFQLKLKWLKNCCSPQVQYMGINIYAV